MLLLTPAFVPVIQSDGLVGFILLTMGWAFFATTAHTGIIWVGLKMKRDTLLLSEATLGMLMGLLIFGAYGGGK